MISVSWFIPETRWFPWQQFDYNRVLPSVWIRCLQLIPSIERSDISCTINQESSKTQIAIFLRCFNATSLARMKRLKARGVKVFVDTPVNYFSEISHLAFEGDAKKYFNEMALLANGVLCASRSIQKAGETRCFKTYYFPDSIDTNHFKPQKKNLNLKKPRLVWSGNSKKASVLNFFAPMIREQGFKFLIISEKKPTLDFSYEFAKWDYVQFPNQLLRADVGIFPRDVSNEYDQGHSFFKIGVCLALHIPVLYSPVPSYEEIANTSNSLLVSDLSIASWQEALFSLQACNLDFRLNPVLDEYSLSVTSAAYVDFFREILKQ